MSDLHNFIKSVLLFVNDILSVFVAGMLSLQKSAIKKPLCSVTEDFHVLCDGKDYSIYLIKL